MKTNEQMTKELIERGAQLEKKQNSHGETKTGWWMDDVYLGKDAKTALEALNG